ncbi:MAG: hypothetical protein IPK27_12170 [Rhodanobacteraceae bacterium]|nr:hypothetical protein [Rhodanobacteraceae bacterium]
MNAAHDIEMLTQLAQGRLAPEERLALARRALTDPALARDMKLAMRLAGGGAETARDWVALAQKPAVQAAAQPWWRPLAGVAASLAILAAVMAMPRMPAPGNLESQQMAQMPSAPGDRIGEMSFEAPELFGGSFEAN